VITPAHPQLHVSAHDVDHEGRSTFVRHRRDIHFSERVEESRGELIARGAHVERAGAARATNSLMFLAGGSEGCETMASGEKATTVMGTKIVEWIVRKLRKQRWRYEYEWR